MNITLDLANADEDFLDQLAKRVADELEARQGTAPKDDHLLRGATAIAEYIGCGRDRIYELRELGEIWPVKKDGGSLVARPSDLDKWVAQGGGKRRPGTRTAATTSTPSTTTEGGSP